MCSQSVAILCSLFASNITGTFAKDSAGKLDNTTYEFNSLSDILIGGQSNYAEHSFKVQINDGFEWNNWQEFDLNTH